MQQYKVRIYKIGPSGGAHEVNYPAKIVNNELKIQTGQKWELWKFINIKELPKTEWIDEENRIYYAEITPLKFKQLKREINIKEQMKSTLFSPVDSDVKYGTIIAIHKVRAMLIPESAWQKILPYMGLLLMVVMFVVGYAMLINKSGGG